MQILDATLGMTILTIVDSILIIGEPKYYILESVEQAKADFEHAEAGTIGSEDYKYELQMASDRAKNKIKK